MHWRTKLAALGGLVCLSAALATAWQVFHAPVPQWVAASRSHSFRSDTVKTGFCGPTPSTRWIKEDWSWQWPKQIVVGDSRRLRVQAELTEHIETRPPPVREGCDARTNVSKPTRIQEPMTLMASGPFKWGGDQKQTTPPGHPNPLIWSSLLTAEEAGDKLIQIELPVQKSQTPIVIQRSFQKDGAPFSRDDRFVVLPVNVAPAGLVSPNVQTATLVLAWIVGPAFSAPWLVWLFKRVFMREDPTDIA